MTIRREFKPLSMTTPKVFGKHRMQIDHSIAVIPGVLHKLAARASNVALACPD